MNAKETVEMLVNWFLQNYEDPVNYCMYDSKEGGYQYIDDSEPYSARDVLETEFPDVSSEIIELAVEQIESDGIIDWVLSENYDFPEEDSLLGEIDTKKIPSSDESIDF